MLKIKNTTISSPYFLAPINTGFAQRGCPTDKLISFHRLRSGNDIGISYVGNVAVARDYVTNDNTLYFDKDIISWKQLRVAITDNGSVAGIQLACRVGSGAPSRRWRPKDRLSKIEQLRREFAAIPTATLDRIVKHFAQAAERAVESGFRVVQVHAAHGYLLSQSLNSAINRRKDEYGNVAFLTQRVIEGIRRLDDAVIADVRISLSDFDQPGLNDESRGPQEAILHLAHELRVDMISLSSGSYEISRDLIYPSRNAGNQVYLKEAALLAEQQKAQVWNVAGNIRAIPPFGPNPDNLTYSIGRPLIADPMYVSKLRHGNPSAVEHCRWTGHCHYYTRGKSHIECPVSQDLNPTED